MKIFAETERLILREILPTDIEGMYELDSDPEVHKFLGNKPITDRSKIIAIINYVRQQYLDNGIGRWAIIEKQSNEFVGWAGLKLVQEQTNKHINYYDLGYRLIRKYWGQGIAAESASVSLNYGFEILKLSEIYAATHIENATSNKILSKLGLIFIETFKYDGEEHNWYKIEETEWTKRKSNC